MIVFSNPTRSEAPECLAVRFRFMQSSVVQHSDWLTQLNLRLLDSNDPYSVSQPFFTSSVEADDTEMGILISDSLIDG